jgi:hypothetical protein
MSLATLELASRIAVIGLDILDFWDAAGVNAEQLRADRQRARDAGHPYGAEEVAAAFARMGVSGETLDEQLELETGEGVERLGDDAVDNALEQDPPA